jgi:hypothetical protein
MDRLGLTIALELELLSDRYRRKGSRAVQILDCDLVLVRCLLNLKESSLGAIPSAEPTLRNRGGRCGG